MQPSQLLAALRRVECFRDMDEDDLVRVANYGHEVRFGEGATIFREGDAAETSFLIISGSLSLEICAPGTGCRRITTVRDGEFVGWSPVLENDQLTVTARAVTPVTLIALPRADLLSLCEESPRFGYLFMKGIAQTLARRLSAARVQLLNLYGDEALTPEARE